MSQGRRVKGRRKGSSRGEPVEPPPRSGGTGAARPGRGRRSALAGSAVIVAALAVAFLVLRPGRTVRLPGAPSFNILLITLDTTRADHLGCYGDARAETPHLDRLAREGARFARAYCPAPLTLPAHCTLMTGTEPVAHGVRNNGHHLGPGTKTLAEALKEAGYSTAAFVSSFSVDSRFGLDRGFDVYDDTFRSDMPFKTLNAERRAGETLGRLSRWLEKRSAGRFFAWVHFYDPHWPYDPPSPHKERFAERPYDGEIAYMDANVGALMDRLREAGLLEGTLVVVAGDHGEGLGGKVERGHGIFLYEETLRVPLIMSCPAILPKPRVIENQVRLSDIAPTVLDMAGLRAKAASMSGLSLVPMLEGKNRVDRDALVESIYPRENFGWSELVGLVSEGWKFIQAPLPELYDLGADPDEGTNLVGTDPGRAGEMRRKLERALLAASSGAGPSAEGAAPRPADLERLRALGYVSFAPSKPGTALPDPKEKLGLLAKIQDAQAFELEDRYAEAERVYLELLEEIPDTPAGYVNLAIAQARQDKFDLAVGTLRRGLARLPDSVALQVRLGHTLLVMGKPGEAFEAMTRALALESRNVDALTVCAGILEGGGRRDEARAYYERALAVEPESRHLRTSLAANLASMGKLREGIEVYKGLIADFPEEQAYYQYAGIAHSYLGEFEQALSYLKQALAIAPTAVGYFNLAVTYEKAGSPAEAAENLRLYLDNAEGESEVNVKNARAALERLEKRPAD